MTYRVQPGSNFLAGICISPINHFALIDSQYSKNHYCCHLQHYQNYIRFSRVDENHYSSFWQQYLDSLKALNYHHILRDPKFVSFLMCFFFLSVLTNLPMLSRCSCRKKSRRNLQSSSNSNNDNSNSRERNESCRSNNNNSNSSNTVSRKDE